jgi:hypothetical protein
MHARTDAHTAEIDHLENLAAEVTARGYQADLRTAAGKLPCLDVRNARATVLSERVYSQDGSFWWSWGERIAGCDQAATAARLLARVLRAVGEQP